MALVLSRKALGRVKPEDKGKPLEEIHTPEEIAQACVKIGDDIVVTVLTAINGKTRLHVVAPKEVKVLRGDANETEASAPSSAGIPV